MGVVKVKILDSMRFDAIGRFFKGNWLELLNFIIRDSDLSPVILAGSLFDELDTASLFFTWGHNDGLDPFTIVRKLCFLLDLDSFRLNNHLHLIRWIQVERDSDFLGKNSTACQFDMIKEQRLFSYEVDMVDNLLKCLSVLCSQNHLMIHHPLWSKIALELGALSQPRVVVWECEAANYIFNDELAWSYFDGYLERYNLSSFWSEL